MQLHILAGGLLNQTMMTFSCKRIRNKKGGERRAPFLQSQETFAIYSKLLAKLRVRGFLHGLPGLQRLHTVAAAGDFLLPFQGPEKQS